jgi:hypothetical protein
MPNLILENVEAAIIKAMNEVARQARLNIGSEQTIRGNDGRLKRRRIDASGALRQSISVTELKRLSGYKYSIGIDMEEYGEYVDQGVSGTRYSTPEPSPFRFRNEGVGPDMQNAILKWAKIRGIRLRDKDGKFIQGTFSSTAYKGLAYVIARGIKRRGISQTYFITTPFRLMEQTLPGQIREALEKDLENFFNDLEP